MSISFQSTSTNNNNNNKTVETASAAFVTTSQMAIAVASVVQRPGQPQPNGHIIIPPLLPNSALYQYNNEQMIHMHELYDDQQPQQAPIVAHHHHHHRSQPEATGRSTDV